MTFEADFETVLRQSADRVFPDFAPTNTVRPYVTYQGIGGDVINNLANTKPGKRNAVIQVNVWSNTRKEAQTLIGDIEDKIRAATAFIGKPMAGAVADFDAEVPVRGARQDFTCWFDG